MSVRTPPRGGRDDAVSVDSLPSRLSLGGDLGIELLGRRNAFFGLGAVSHGDVVLRSGQRPMFVEIRNPSGVELVNYCVTRCEVSSQGALVSFSVDRREGGPMEWMVHEVRARYNTADWSRAPRRAEDTVLELELRAVERIIGRCDLFRAFPIATTIAAKAFPSTRFSTAGTWEIGGSAIGNEFWMRNCFVPSITRIESERNSTRPNGISRIVRIPSALQFLRSRRSFRGSPSPRRAEGVLVTWASEVVACALAF